MINEKAVELLKSHGISGIQAREAGIDIDKKLSGRQFDRIERKIDRMLAYQSKAEIVDMKRSHLDKAMGKRILDWFGARAGDHIDNDAYQVLLLELKDILDGLS